MVMFTTQQIFVCSMSTTETIEICSKLPRNTPERRHISHLFVSIDFGQVNAAG